MQLSPLPDTSAPWLLPPWPSHSVPGPQLRYPDGSSSDHRVGRFPGPNLKTVPKGLGWGLEICVLGESCGVQATTRLNPLLEDALPMLGFSSEHVAGLRF